MLSRSSKPPATVAASSPTRPSESLSSYRTSIFVNLTPTATLRESPPRHLGAVVFEPKLPRAVRRGTVFSPTEKGTETTMSLLRRTRVKTLLLSGRTFVGKDSQTLGEFMDWSLVEAKNRLQTQFAGKGTRA